MLFLEVTNISDHLCTIPYWIGAAADAVGPASAGAAPGRRRARRAPGGTCNGWEGFFSSCFRN